MDVEEFRERGKEMVDYICKYMTTLKKRRVTPTVEPGYLQPLIPKEAPYDPDNWDDVMEDIESKIMPGVTHWQHPRFHAYFPSGNAYPSILGDMLQAGIASIGFSWAACPAQAELEIVMMNWLGKALGLPSSFLTVDKDSKGGGVLQGSASDCVFVCMVAARAATIIKLKHKYPTTDEGVLLSKLMAYCSKEAHSCVEKGAMISFVKIRILETDYNGSLRADTLREAMEEDTENGLIPFFVSTTLGTTSGCDFDNLTEIGPVVRKFPYVWLHVDAAYAGNSFLCPEHRCHLAGIEYADSFNTNPNKLMLTNFDASLMWVKDRLKLTSALVVNPLYLSHTYDSTAIDFRHWGIPLSRRFRSLKLWFMLRSFGIKGLQKYVRLHCELAKYFESLVKKDSRFEICNQVKLGLVCFRLIEGAEKNHEDGDKLNMKLLSNINASGKIHMVPAMLRERYVIRFCVVHQYATREDIEIAWKIITEYANELLEEPDKMQKDLDTRHRKALAHKRSFFVRMVSDPNIYNPGINKTPPPMPTSPMTPLSAGPVTPGNPSESGSVVSSKIKNSWISWPLAFLFQSADDDSKDLPLRFRHLDTTVRLKSPSHGRRDPSPSASPERRSISPSPHY